jgi:hypothetical protein
MADHAKPWNHHDVDFRVAEEPEEVLVHDRVATAVRIKEMGAEVPVCYQHGDRPGENRQRHEKHEGRYEDRPDEEGHAMKGHPGRPHIQNRGDHIDCA